MTSHNDPRGWFTGKWTSRFFGLVLVFASLLLGAQVPEPATFSLSQGDVVEAIVFRSSPARLKVMLTPEKSEALSAFTGLNLNKQVRIVVAGKVRSEPFVRERMTGPAMELYVKSPEDALATVKALLTSSKLSFDQLQTWSDSTGTHYAEKRPAGAENSGPPLKLANRSVSDRILRELQGSWVVTAATMNGKQNHDRALLEANWKFEGNELILESRQKGTARFTISIDEQAKPQAFHLTTTAPADTGSGWMLFSRATNTLKIAFYDNLEGRPEGFEPRQARGKPELVVVTLSPKPTGK